MTRLIIRFPARWRWSRLGLLLLLGLLIFSPPAHPVEGAHSQEASSNSNSYARLFYLTDANYYTDQPLTACASGYHMASLWEILDPSNLVYDFNHPDAHTKTDSGQGPPSYWYGWVRTGQNASSSSTTGTGNCNAWTSRDGSDRGVSVRLIRDWENPPGEVGGIWDASSFACSIPGPVWCVQDAIDLSISGSALPSPVKLGGELSYDITLLNQGPSQAIEAQASGEFSGNTNIIQAIPSQGSCTLGGTTYSCDLGNLANQDQAVISLQVIPLETGTFTNTTSLSGFGFDPHLGDNLAIITTTVNNQDIYIPLIRK